MSSDKVKYTVTTQIDPTDLPSSDKIVVWDTSEGEFALNDDLEIGVGPLSPTQGTFYGTFATSNDSSLTRLSGSDFTYQRIDTTNDRSEFRFLSSSDTLATAHFHPVRLADTTSTSNRVPVSSYQYVYNYHRTATNAGTDSLGTFQTPPSDHEGIFGETRRITGSFSILKIEHTAYVTGSNPRMQFMTHHVAWSKDENNIGIGLRTLTMETARLPYDQAIVDPRSITASFSDDGAIKLTGIHFALAADHDYKFTVI